MGAECSQQELVRVEWFSILTNSFYLNRMQGREIDRASLK